MYLVLKEDDLKTEYTLQYVDEMLQIYRCQKTKPPVFILEVINSWIVGRAAHPAYLVTIFR